MQIIRIFNVRHLAIALTVLIGLASCLDKPSKGEMAINLEQGKAVHSNDTLSFGNFTIGEPISEGNLQVFLIHGQEELGKKAYTILSTAMDDKKVTVKETGDVNQLSISNNGDSHVFIHTGDIVKGGKQDRTIAQDVIIAPGAKNVPLESFCVEQGRWQKREGEELSRFGSNDKMLSSRKLKMAARYEKNQGKVWQNVQEEQTQLNENISIINGYDVAVEDTVSETSLQLTLESDELKKAKKKMEQKFVSILKDNETAIGYAYAINGEIYGVDIYNNKKLFNALWDKIAESIMTESVSNRNEEDLKSANKSDVVLFMEAIDTKDRKKSTQEINEATALEILENEKEDVVFSTIDKRENKWIHNNYMKKDKESMERNENGLNILNQRRTRN